MCVSYTTGQRLWSACSELEDLAALGNIEGAGSLTAEVVGAVKRLVEALSKDAV